MTLTTFLIVLFAAALHASWNALVKSTGDKVVSMTAITLGHAPLALLAMPFVPLPAPESWPLLAMSVVVHTCYQFSLMMAYRLGDFTQVYPIARGSGPAIVTLVSIFSLGVYLAPTQIAAISLIVAGIFCLSLLKQTDGLRNPKAVGAALLTGCFIAGYSLLDGLGARAAGTAFGYIAWMTAINAVTFSIIIAIFRPSALKRVFTEGQRTLWIGGSASVLAYVLVVWAMTQAPIALVTALRETSTVFALFIGVLFLKERLTKGKILATLLTLSGVLLLRFGA
ncbi:MAG: EamA family transporter [Rhizobiaceae bacterium]